MKKVLIIILSIFLLIIVAVGGYFYVFDMNKTKALKNKMETAAKSYFEEYVSMNETNSAYDITLEMIEEANEMSEDFDVKGLESCDSKNTFARIFVNYKTGKPKKIEVKLNC